MIPATLIRYRYGRYSRNALDRDVDGIRALYHANGFRDVEVIPAKSTTTREKPPKSPF